MEHINWCSNPDLRVPGTFGTPASPTIANIPNGAYVPYGTIPPPPALTDTLPEPPMIPPAAYIVDRGARPSWFYVGTGVVATPPVASPPQPSPPPTYNVTINYAPNIQAGPPAPPYSATPASGSSRSRAITSAPHSQSHSYAQSAQSVARSSAPSRSNTHSSSSRHSQMSLQPISGSHAPSHASHRSSTTRVSHGGSHGGHMGQSPRYEVSARPPIGMIAPSPSGYQAPSLSRRTDYIQRPATVVTRGPSRPPAAPEAPSHVSRHSHHSSSGTSRGSDSRSVRVPEHSAIAGRRSAPPGARSDSRTIRSPPPAASAGSRSRASGARGGGVQEVNINCQFTSDSLGGGSRGAGSTNSTLRPEDSMSSAWRDEDRQRSRRDDARREERRARRG